MAKPAAIMGSLTDVRNIAANKSVRLSIEVPAEKAREVIDAFGWATAVNPVAVAVARLSTNVKEVMPSARPTAEQHDTSPRPAGNQVGGDKPKRAWGDLAPAQQAGIRCNEESFRAFLTARNSLVSLISADEAADIIRDDCGVSSRSEIMPGTKAASRWHQLDGDYEAWLRYGEMA